MLPHIPKSYIDEINGLAVGSGLTFDQVLAAQAFLDLKKAVQCSTIALDGPMTRDGEPMMGRNLDFPSLGVAHRHSIVIVRHPTRGPVTVTVGWPLLIGTLSGMSDRGVAVAMMEVTTDASSLDGMPYPLLYRRALELAQTTEDVVAFIRKSRRTASNNLMVLDRLGASALIEITAQEVAVRRPTSHKLYATNHHRAPKLKRGATCGRYHTITKKLGGRSAPMGVAEMKALLDAVDIEVMNLQAMIFLPRSGTLHLSVGRIPAAKGPFVELTRGRLFTRPK
jgi:predicted choloylglycine hydrolase